MSSESRRRERGAAAVEFALVLPILMMLVFGIINYGLWFNDANNARQGIRETARRAVVEDFPTCGAATTPIAKIQCTAKSQAGSLTGPSYAAVYAPNGWAKGNPLYVCVVVAPANFTKIVPIPKYISTKTSMSIEVDSPAPSPAITNVADTLPTGASWQSGCTP